MYVCACVVGQWLLSERVVLATYCSFGVWWVWSLCGDERVVLEGGLVVITSVRVL